LLHASFRPRLATTPLRFANPSPPSGWMEDFHLQAVDHARHTEKTPHEAGPFINGYAAPREERLDGADLTVAGPGGGVHARRVPSVDFQPRRRPRTHPARLPDAKLFKMLIF
jgi:hypothetical protein